MEATIFRGWIYDYLFPHAAVLKVVHPRMLRAIAATKKKNDRIDAHKIADCLRCNFLPECCMASREIRERRRTLLYRNLLVRQAVQIVASYLFLLSAVEGAVGLPISLLYSDISVAEQIASLISKPSGSR
jgi:Transposase